MGGDDLDDLVLVGSPRRLQVGGDGEVLVLAVALWERLVGDGPHEVLQEAVLAALGRPRVGLERDDLLAHEGGEQLVERVGTEVGEREQRRPAEGLADDGGVLEKAPLCRREAVETSRDERVQGLGDVEGADRRRPAGSWSPPARAGPGR